MDTKAHGTEPVVKYLLTSKTLDIKTLSKLSHTFNITNRLNPASVSLLLRLSRLTAIQKCRRPLLRGSSTFNLISRNSLTSLVLKIFSRRLLCSSHVDISTFSQARNSRVLSNYGLTRNTPKTN